ncbi:LacI family DNA-binding transcriptional regulator [Microbacterium sp. 22242]|uniref:LacI family DNA-binding transcriptional regulator n=1 Tax=Microbacterium sp. 22242 TaxID=3453896 RepID=UPI003F87A936
MTEDRSHRPTSRDVARLAGVSQSTVSFVLTGRNGISEATRERVLGAAAQLNYRPNLAARSMRTRRSGRLAVLMPITALNDSTILEGAASAAQEAGYTLEIVSLPPSPDEREQRLTELIGSGQYEGFLSFTAISSSARAADPSGPVVLSLLEFDDKMHMTGAFIDAQPIVEMIERLAALGHRRFLHIAGPPEYPSAIARRDAYVATIERLGLESLGVLGGAWSGEVGYSVIEDLPESAVPLAVIAANDVSATGAMRAATLRGWTMPGDMSITGWDDRGASAFLVPSLTSVVQDRVRLGEHSMRRLIAAVRGEPDPEPVTGYQHIVWRESVAAPAPRPPDRSSDAAARG